MEAAVQCGQQYNMPIDAIYGPFCDELLNIFIAHETNTAAIQVPIIQDDDEQVLIPEDAEVGAYGVACFDGDVICCTEPTISTFVNQSVTEIVYGAVLQAKHGPNPSVFVYYFDSGTGMFTVMGDFTKVAFDGYPVNKITVNHGGELMTGKIKIV